MAGVLSSIGGFYYTGCPLGALTSRPRLERCASGITSGGGVDYLRSKAPAARPTSTRFKVTESFKNRPDLCNAALA